jgi:Fur family ferric uptake transcriptional regulator
LGLGVSDMEEKAQWSIKRLEESEYRLTKPRHAILETLANTNEHLSAEEIYQRVYREYPAIGLTTVYRTLELFVRIGIVLRFDFGDGRSRFELSVGPEVQGSHHHHLVCTNCNKIIDYTDFIEDEIDLLKKTEKGLETLHNFTINNHIIAFYGLCENCRNEKKGVE